MNTPTIFSPIQMYPAESADCIYGVIIHVSQPKNGRLDKFKLTTSGRDICTFMNSRKTGYRLKLFTSPYDAEMFIKSKLSFEDKFSFHLEQNQPVIIDKWYIRDC